MGTINLMKSIRAAVSPAKQAGTARRAMLFLSIALLIHGSLVVRAGAAAIAASDSSNVDVLGEVVVTAERRTESAQKVPVSLNVVSGDDIAREGISQPEDMDKLVPGLMITNDPVSQPSIRGVGSPNNNVNSLATSGIATTIDGVFIGRVTEIAGNFFDLERVEVLKGPQGTLYGRNSAGGAINVISQEPTQEFGGFLESDLGNYNLRRFTAALNLPISDTLALRLSVYDSKRDGYLTDGYDDENTRAERIQALWKPNDDISLRLIVSESRVGGLGSGQAFENYGNGRVGVETSGYANMLNSTYALIPTLNGVSPVPRYVGYQDFNTHSVSAELNWDLGFATLTVLPAYKNQGFGYASGVTPNGSFESTGGSHQTSEEIRLANRNDKFNWTVGAYHFDESVNFDLNARFDNFSLPFADVFNSVNQYLSAPNLATKSTAAFGDIVYDVVDRLRLLAGLRYTTETKTADLTSQWYGEGFNIPGHSVTATDPMTGLPTPLYAYANPDSLYTVNTSGRVGFDYDLMPKSMLYFTVARGFESGGFGLAPLPQAVYKPEFLTAFTLGIKNRFDDDRIQLNGEVFYWDFKDQQLSVVVPDIYGALESVTVNAGKTNIEGADVSLEWAPDPADHVSTELQYEHAIFAEYTVITGLGPSATPSGCVYTPTTVNGYSAYSEDCRGSKLPFAPEFAGITSYMHSFALESGASIAVGGDVHYRSKYISQVSQDPAYISHGYALTDLEATFFAPSKKWHVEAYVRNVTNKIVYDVPGVNSFSPLQPANSTRFSTILPPRTYGLLLNVKF